jgi:hypothetical protein
VEALDFEAVEGALRRRVLQLAARAIEHRLNADRSDDTGPSRPCPCGRRARYAGRRAKRFTTVLGDLTLERAYYHCAACGQGGCPRDRALGLAGTTLSPAVTRMVGAVGALVSFAEGSALLHELAGVRVDPTAVERTAEVLGQAIAADEQAPGEPAPAPAVPTLYLGLDGTGIPMRKAELADRPGKQADGSAKTREVKLCTVWSAEARDAHGLPMRDAGSVSYSAAIESVASRDTDPAPAAFTQRVLREAARRGFAQVARRVVLGDGAAWIWNLADEHFPAALQIVDLFHAKEHLTDVATAIYGPTSAVGRQWAARRAAELEAGAFPALFRALARHAAAHPPARQCLEYLQRNRSRMRYPAFRAAGLCTSTGVVEAGCKVAIGTRLKRAGMHWTLRGANAIIALRCCRLSGRFEGFWERRADAQRAA